jgi:hypothetical protein
LHELENSIVVFLEKLDYHAVLTALMEFDSAVKAREYLKTPSSGAGVQCASIISALDKKESEAETAAALPDFWNGVPEFEGYVLLQAVESRVSRALLMLSCTKAYHWVASMATEAVKFRQKKNCWIYELVKDVEAELNYRNRNPDHPKEATFYSENYLPLLSSPSQATVVLKRWGLDKDDEKDLKMIQVVSSIIETWLQFPTSKDNKNKDKLRCSLISIIIRHLPLSILLLDSVWLMFVTPYNLLIHGRSKQRVSQPHTAETVKLFEQCIQKHSMSENNSTSKEYLLLSVLTEESEKWYQRIALNMRKEHQRTAPLYNKVCFILHNVIL